MSWFSIAISIFAIVISVADLLFNIYVGHMIKRYEKMTGEENKKG